MCRSCASSTYCSPIFNYITHFLECTMVNNGITVMYVCLLLIWSQADEQIVALQKHCLNIQKVELPMIYESNLRSDMQDYIQGDITLCLRYWHSRLISLDRGGKGQSPLRGDPVCTPNPSATILACSGVTVLSLSLSGCRLSNNQF